MSSETISIRFKIDGTNEFKTLEVDVKSASDALNTMTLGADNLNNSFVRLASKTQIFESLAAAVQQLNSTFQELSAAYEQQSVAETRLEQAMRNTMNASNEEIESIKQLCSAQQQLGVIGDEVQLAASQELATYLTMSDTLKTLIPVMNDMVAQQYGLGASAESATQIASMLGKVMNGQTEALSRYGYKFDEVQKYILQYGDESERAAVLSQVVSESVGGMNAAMARTPAGQMQKVRNTIGDMKETLGEFTTGLSKVITLLSGITNIVSGWQRMKAAMEALSQSTVVLKIQSLGLAASTRVMAMAQRLATTSAWSATFGTYALKTAVAALWGALTLGISYIITGIISLFSSLASSANDAAESIEEVEDATKAYNDAASDARGEIVKEIVSLGQLIKSKEDTTQAIKNLNEKYGEIFGSHATAKEWYDTLINKSKEYCKQLGYEAAAKKVASELGELYVQQDDLEKRQQELNDKQDSGQKLSRQEKKEQKKINEELEATNKQIQEKEPKLDEYTEKAGQARNNLKDNNELIGPPAPINYNVMSISELEAQKKEQEDILKNATDIDSTVAQNAKEQLATIKKIQKEKEEALGLNEKSSKPTPKSDKSQYDGTSLIENAKTYKELGNNVKYYEDALDKADITDKEHIATLAKSLAETKRQQQAKKDVIDAAMLEASKPTSPQSMAEVTSLEQIDKAIEYQRKIRGKADKEQLKAIDDEIDRLNTLKTAFEESTHEELQDDQIKSFQQLQDEISFYSQQLQRADDQERLSINKKIQHLEKLRKQWQEVLDEMDKPGDISTLNTIEELDEAISWYGNHQKKVSGEEYLDIQRIIIALEKKKKLMEAPVTTEKKIADMQSETSQLNSLKGKTLNLELKLIGFDAIIQKIKSLQQMLNDPRTTESQKKALKDLQAQYVGYAKQLLKTDQGMIQSWGTIKGLSSGIEGMTQAIEGQGSAWKKVTSIIDATIQLYQSMSGIIEIVKALTGAEKQQAAATEIKGVAAIESATETATAAGIEISASQAVTSQNKVETTSNVAKGVSGFFSAHSSIPFVGFAIGAALVAAFLAMMAGLPKFAEGGVAFGPTLGIFGEYSGASTNPEVVAPLDKLKDLIGSDDGGAQKVVFKIDGRTLVGVLEKQNKYLSRI